MRVDYVATFVPKNLLDDLVFLTESAKKILFVDIVSRGISQIFPDVVLIVVILMLMKLTFFLGQESAVFLNSFGSSCRV